MHSLIYQPVERARAELERMRARRAELTARPLDELTAEELAEGAELDARIPREQAKIDSPDWILREESDLDAADLLVLDEVSMVGERMALDLLSYGTKILCLGDPAQLPPVDGGGYFIDAQPDHLLTEIHRSALDSPVTRLATVVRNSPVGQRSYGITGRDGDSGRRERLTIAELLSYDQVLTGRNATRWQACHLMRALRGLTTPHPTVGDRIMALANSSELSIFNGQQFDVITESAVDVDHPDRYRVEVRDDEGNRRLITAWAAGFVDLEGEKRAKRDGRGNVAAMTWAQAITTHKSQGSQWPRVLVVDEAYVFAGAARRDNERAGMPRGEVTRLAHIAGQRWLYTAVTRASERVTVVPGLNGLVTA